MINTYKLRIAAALMLVILIASSFTACGSFKAGAPEGIVGKWKCEETASDKKTDTGFYELRIEKDGEFSLYDAAAGNPGISGKMGNDTGNSVDCEFDMDDFDVPFCWTIDSSADTLQYKINGDTLKLGHNGVWLIFHPKENEDVDLMIPKPLDELITFKLPKDFKFDMQYPYGGEDGKPIVEKAYTSENKGYFAAGIFSYKGWDCLGDINSTIDLEESVKYLAGIKKIKVAGETGYFGTRESDDMPDMVAIVYVEHGEYIFEFRLTNSDEQVTKEQIENFKQILGTVEFKY